MPIGNHRLDKEIRKNVSMDYQLFLPDEYEDKKDKKWPLILFLHGIKKRGEDIHLLDNYGLTWIAESTRDFEFIVMTPQCPSFSSWPMERDAVLTLLEEIGSTHRVDLERVYLTGFSMGGNGAWDLSAYAPDRFAAVAPLAGWFDPERALLLKEIPIWAFHGEDDDVVSVQGSEAMVNALRNMGSNVKYTTYPGLRHNVMTETFSNPELYSWLLSHKKRSVE